MIIDGRAIAEDLVASLIAQLPYVSHKSVCFVTLGDNAVSKRFVAVKSAFAKRLGIEVALVEQECITTSEALGVITETIAHGYDGIVVQLPLPYGIDTNVILDAIPLDQDIDMLGRDAKDAYKRGDTKRLPAVVGAIHEILTHHHIVLAGKMVVVVGKGRLVGEPVQAYLSHHSIAHTVIDIDTESDERSALLLEADVVISGIGVPHSIMPDMVKEGVILIDAGTSEQSGRLVGDIHSDCASKATLFTPVPGGVGPVTVACLFQNVLRK